MKKLSRNDVELFFTLSFLFFLSFLACAVTATIAHVRFLAWVFSIASALCFYALASLADHINKLKKAANPLKSTRFFTLRWVPDDPGDPESTGSYQTVLVSAEELLNEDSHS